MSFDQTNPTDLAALKSEVNNDPLSIGYAAVIDNTNQLLRLLNDADNNTGGETTNVELTVSVLLDEMVVDDFDSNQVTDGERRFIESFLNRELNISIEQWRSKIRDAFKTSSATVANIDALVRSLSRAEVLFGEGTTITRNDWIAARNS